MRVAAQLLAVAALYRDRIWPLLGAVVELPIRLLRVTHSGIYTDYILYMIGGLAFVTLWLTSAIPVR